MKILVIMKNLVILVFDFGESCESGHFCETSDSDDSGESSDSSFTCYVGESGDLINKVILVILVNKLILINRVGVVIF